MAPPCTVFSAAELDARIQLNAHGRRRKPALTDNGGADDSARQQRQRDVDLERDCAQRRLTQFECEIQDPARRDSPIVCFPFTRIFRECADRNGKFTVETTPREGDGAAKRQV